MDSRTHRASRSAWSVWAVGLLLYLLAVFHRSSLAVAGIEATDRFGISAAQLSTFTMLQLLVYAGLQVPVGLALDRFGPRRLLMVGIVLMTLGQVVFALSESYPVALGARVLVGAGDAMTFVCVLRLVTAWFAPTRVPLVTQLTGVTGQLGGVVAAAPMTWAFHELGWTAAYLVAASVGVVLLALLSVVVRDAPDARRAVGPPMSWSVVRRSLGASWEHPGTRLGFWTHFTTPFSCTALGLLWGFPFFVLGEGRSEAVASALLTVMVVAAMATGPVLAMLITRYPWNRSDLVIGIVGSIAGVWTAVLVWPGEAPLALLVLLAWAVGVGGPASMIGFDYGREFNPPDRLGAATGLINQAGFIAGLVLVVAIGVVLDWRTPAGSDYTPEAFRWAMSCQYVLWGVGLRQIVRFRRAARQLTLRAPS